MRRQKRLSIEVIFLIRFRAMVKEGKCFEYKKYVAYPGQPDWDNLQLFLRCLADFCLHLPVTTTRNRLACPNPAALCISQEADWFSLITNLYLFIDYPPKPKN